jgi:ATP-binding cassette subfamily C (CFTR/MRP) protein 4
VLTLGILAVSAIVIPYLLIVYPFIAYMFIRLRDYYMKTTRQIKRIEAITRSPVYSAIPSTLEGLSTIRAFSAKGRFLKDFFHNQDENTRMFFAFVSSGRWLGLRLDLLTALLITAIIFIAVPLRDNLGLTPALIGLLITYLIQMTGTLQWAVRQFSEVENLMVSVERIFEYSKLPSERPAKTGCVIPNTWPESGKIIVKNMSLKYPNADPTQEGNTVLKNISFIVNSGEKIGIVGRTGAGKSTLLQALFRIVEPCPEKSISIDGIYTSDLGLDDLRSRISIIPQEPFCFKGTLRFNLDPFGKCSDQELWDALGAVELKHIVESIPEKLDAPVAENGSNWSVGERQLICLGRAILKNSKLIVMDEATSSVDLRTDQMILKSTKTLFANSTVLTIAHRLLTVIEYDKILVMEKGEVVEFGNPADLLSKNASEEGSWFAKMVREMGPEAEANLKSIARNKSSL